MAISEKFQSRFQEMVEDLGLKTCREATKQIGITTDVFIKIHKYGILPSVPNLVKIADFFEVPFLYLIGESDDDYFVKSSSPVTFKERLLQLKESKGIKTTYELAENLHIHRNNLAQWINKNNIPTLETLETVADYFEVSIDYLLGRTDYKD